MDRNWYSAKILECITVALRKESVDRNKALGTAAMDDFVALRKESVDRNEVLIHGFLEHPAGRSPQGERG